MTDPPASAHPPPNAHVALVLGGARSGKSALAERLVLARAAGGPVHYLATATVDGTDADLAARVAAHRDRRDGRFRTVEAAGDLPAALAAVPPGEAVLVDALGTWLASPAVTPAWAGGAAGDLDAHTDRQVAALADRRAATVVVSDEAGLGVHPEHPVGRRWRDALGTVNQRVAEVAGDAWLVVAGRVLPLARPEGAGGPASELHDDMRYAPGADR
jgi:adenosyl cobinamide kinase/adenosyl cobinamide phosphate guanylyltransferase